MKHSYLEVTCRRGRPVAAYYSLPRRDGDKSVRTERADLSGPTPAMAHLQTEAEIATVPAVSSRRF